VPMCLRQVSDGQIHWGVNWVRFTSDNCYNKDNMTWTCDGKVKGFLQGCGNTTSKAPGGL